MSDSVRTRVAFRVAEGEIVPETVRVRRNTIFLEVEMPTLNDAYDLGMDVRQLEGLELDPKLCQVKRGDDARDLSRLEMKALLALVDAYPRGVTKEELREVVKQDNSVQPESIIAYVSRVRRKTEGLLEIRTIWGVGWVLELKEDA